MALSREGVCRASDRHRTQRALPAAIGSRAGSSGRSGRSIILIAAAFYYEKAADHRSAFVRWRPQVLQFWDGVNIYDKMLFPNPPIMPITLYPLMVLPTVAGAMCWFAIKVAMTTAVLMMCFRIVQPPGRRLPPMFRSLVLLLSLRPILGDLHHGNNNLLILFLIVAMLYAWRRGLRHRRRACSWRWRPLTR